MRLIQSAASALTMALLAAAAHAAPYYDPSNAASGTGKTAGYELFKTIGCPGKALLDPACKDDAPKDGDGDGVVDGQDKCPTTPKGRKVNAEGCELDGDGDGVVDALDKCPTTPAGRKANAQGCELDSDGDGVVDALDKCPGTPAGAKVNADGCELDSDGDGVVDRLDQCPNTAPGRKVDAKGCEPDADGDGVLDAMDKCPGTPKGDRVDGSGCTLLNTIVLKGVNFDNDQAVLRQDALSILDEASATLKRYPGMKVEVAGYTDGRSSRAHNVDLSQRRAKAVMDYFVGKGVAADRLSAKGYGPDSPIADNNTDAGRAQNRRVELHILN